jgi:hypothetical protein
VYLYHIVFEKEVACVLTIQGSYTREEFKHTGLILQLELQSAVDLVCLLNFHGRGKAFTVRIMKAYRGTKGIAPHILNLALAALSPGNNHHCPLNVGLGGTHCCAENFGGEKNPLYLPE